LDVKNPPFYIDNKYQAAILCTTDKASIILSHIHLSSYESSQANKYSLEAPTCIRFGSVDSQVSTSFLEGVVDYSKQSSEDNKLSHE